MRMLCALTVFLFAVPVLATLKPEYVILVSAFTNKNDVVIISVQSVESGSSTTFTLSCNREDDLCKIPSKGVSYILKDAEQAVYQCQNVALRSGSSFYGVYCLRGAE